MGAIFSGWKRKIGLTTLFLACVLVVGWLRSLSTQDTLTVSFGSSIQCKLISIAGQMIIANVSIDGERAIRTIPWASQKIKKDEWEMVLQLPDSSQFRWVNSISPDLFSIGNGEMGANFISFVVNWCQFPYWSVTTPLTLISLWLLLSKPRTSDQKTTNNPVETAENEPQRS